MKTLFIAGARRREKSANITCVTASVALCRNMYFIPARARCGPYFTSREQRVEASQPLKGRTENFKDVDGP
jgi:hypothetical protein